MKYEDMTLSEYVATIYIALLKPHLSVVYKQRLHNTVARFAEWYGDDPCMGEITLEVQGRYLAEGEPALGHAAALQAVLRSYNPKEFADLRRNRRPLRDTDGPPILLNSFYSQTYEPNALRSRRFNTKRLYRTTLIKFAEFIGRPATLDDLNDETVNGFAVWRSQQKLSKHTVNKDLFNLLALWRWAHRKGYLDNWPDVDMEKAPKETPVAWTEEEMHKIFRVANELTGKVGDVPAGSWWVALLLCCWDTAERVGAVQALKWSHVDTVKRWVKFEAEYRKGARADNLRRIAKDTALALASVKRWQETAGSFNPDGLVFVWDRSPTYLWTRYGEILQAAGLSHDAKSKFHRIRKTAASYYEKAGGNATELLGHTKRETTVAYLDPRIVERPEAVDLLFRPLAASR